MRLAIIPARGGSQRIPGKNIRAFRGKPIIAYAIECALKSGIFDHVLVSTDSEKIAEVAQQYGASTPFLRELNLADNHTPIVPVIRDAILRAEAYYACQADVCCTLLPTSPFVTTRDLIAAYQQITKTPELDFVFSGTSFPFPIQRAVKIIKGRVSMFQPEHQLTRSQDLEPAYHDAGQFYFGTRNAWLTSDGIFNAKSALYELPRFRVQDIDDEQDWIRAELMHELLDKQNQL